MDNPPTVAWYGAFNEETVDTLRSRSSKFRDPIYKYQYIALIKCTSQYQENRSRIYQKLANRDNAKMLSIYFKNDIWIINEIRGTHNFANISIV